jgi:GNAT superfamily N-acetyltransferase/broad-specificity NMP kinase
MNINVSNDLDTGDLDNFEAFYLKHVVNNYPYSGSITARQYINSHLKGYDPKGLFTKRRTIWKCCVGHDVVGFSLATEKRGKSVKFGPTAIKPEYRDQGIGSLFKLELERIYRENGFRKAYCTVGLNNWGAVSYLRDLGYRIEVHFKDHFRFKYDEVVLGKYLLEAPTDSLSNEYDFDLSSADTIDRKIFETISTYCDEVDKTMIDQLKDSFADDLSKDEITFSQKRRKLFADDASGEMVIAIPKRGHCVKLLPILNAENVIRLKAFFFTIEDYLKQRGYEKSYVLCENNRDVINAYRALKFVVEGIVSEPYKPKCDLVVVSRFH